MYINTYALYKNVYIYIYIYIYIYMCVCVCVRERERERERGGESACVRVCKKEWSNNFNIHRNTDAFKKLEVTLIKDEDW